MTRSRRLITIALVAASLALFGVAQAKSLPYAEGLDHDWGGLDAPFSIPKARGSLMLDGRMNNPTDVDAFTYTFIEPVKTFPLQVDVPTCGESNAAFYPTVALVGPGLPVPDASVTLPFDVPEGMGVQTFAIEHARQKRYAYSSYGPELYVIGLRQQVEIPQAGTYTLVVWEPDGHVGPYIVTTGDQEPDFEGMTDDEINQHFQQGYDGQWVTHACAAIPTDLLTTPEATASL